MRVSCGEISNFKGKMMKKIYIIRHAKAEQKGYDKDFERNLNKKGEQEIKDMLKKLGARAFRALSLRRLCELHAPRGSWQRAWA